GWGPRVSVHLAAAKHTRLRAGAAITTLLPNLWLENFVTGGFPLTFQPVLTAKPGVPVPFADAVVLPALPDPYTTRGQLLLPNCSSSRCPAHSAIELERYEKGLVALMPGHQLHLIEAGVIARNFRIGVL